MVFEIEQELESALVGARASGDGELVKSCELTAVPDSTGGWRVEVAADTAAEAFRELDRMVNNSDIPLDRARQLRLYLAWKGHCESHLPELRRMGARVEAELDSCGFYPAAGGVVRLRIWPYDEAKRTERYELTGLGAYKGGVVKGVVSHLQRSIAEAEIGAICVQLRDLGLKRDIQEIDAFGPGNYCCVKLDYERATVVFSGIGTYDKSRKAVANEVAHEVREFVKSGKACEKHLADQLLVPLNILVGGGYKWETDGLWEDEVWHPNWNIVVQKETLHYKTNQDVIAQFSESLRN